MSALRLTYSLVCVGLEHMLRLLMEYVLYVMLAKFVDMGLSCKIQLQTVQWVSRVLMLEE